MSIIKSCTALPPTSTIFHGYRLFVFKPTEYITCILFQICNCKKAAPTRTAFLRFWHMPPFPYPFYLTRSLPEKLVISMFKQEFQMSVKPARVLPGGCPPVHEIQGAVCQIFTRKCPLDCLYGLGRDLATLDGSVSHRGKLVLLVNDFRDRVRECIAPPHGLRSRLPP